MNIQGKMLEIREHKGLTFLVLNFLIILFAVHFLILSDHPGQMVTAEVFCRSVFFQLLCRLSAHTSQQPRQEHGGKHTMGSLPVVPGWPIPNPLNQLKHNRI